jgi:hypothetical protein
MDEDAFTGGGLVPCLHAFVTRFCTRVDQTKKYSLSRAGFSAIFTVSKIVEQNFARRSGSIKRVPTLLKVMGSSIESAGISRRSC